jgi:ornithine decarboxylase
MTPKIAKFLLNNTPQTPFLVVDVDVAEQNYRTLRRVMPTAKIYYAIKANPAPEILRRLVALGSNFDCASIEEITMCLAAGARADQISFGNTIKKSASIARAYALGVRLYVFDCLAELEKIAKHAPGSRVFCRLAVSSEGAVYPLSRKFGAGAEAAADLLRRTAGLGLVPWGLSFHAGSQQTRTWAHEVAIGQVAMLFDELEHDGIKLGMINVGGGFPTEYIDRTPAIEVFASRILRALTYHFGDNQPTLLVEPGRYLAGNAGVIVTEVVLVSQRDPQDPLRWVYLDIGRFGGLIEAETNVIRYRLTTPHDGTEDGPVIIAGPTCDSGDILYDKAVYRMPLRLRDGDRVTMHNAGAYVSTYAAQSFNGFKPLGEYYI